MEQFNHSMFLWLNATPNSPTGVIIFAFFCAKYLILIVPLLAVGLWLWAPIRDATCTRIIITRSVLTLCIGLLLSFFIGMLYPHSRPFVEHLGYVLLHHAPNNSFPSNHGTAIFSFALAFCFWCKKRWAGITLLIVSLLIAWSRIFLGVHWPLDMIGAFLIALLSCAISQIIWDYLGDKLFTSLYSLYRLALAIPIQRGWIKP